VPFLFGFSELTIILVGNGATSVVVKALDTVKNRHVAIKKVKHVMYHRDIARRTLREIRLQRLLQQHENVSYPPAFNCYNPRY
jgi:serine/threonine protein kinase